MARKYAEMGPAIAFSSRLPAEKHAKLTDVASRLNVTKNVLLIAMIDQMELTPEGIPVWWHDYVTRPQQGALPFG